MKTENSTMKGKAIEHYIISELIRNDFNVFVPIVDMGTDILIKNNVGGYVEIQVKSRKEGRSFHIKDFEPSPNFFIVCHIIDKRRFFVMPSCVFHRKSKLKRSGIREMSQSAILRYENFEGKYGLALLEKALKNPTNNINSINEKV